MDWLMAGLVAMSTVIEQGICRVKCHYMAMSFARCKARILFRRDAYAECGMSLGMLSDIVILHNIHMYILCMCCE